MSQHIQQSYELNAIPGMSATANREIAHEVIAYAESCAAGLTPAHAWWQSQYFDTRHPGTAFAESVLLKNGNLLRSGAIFVSLCDRVEIVGLRLLLAMAGVSIAELRGGLKDEHFVPFTTAVTQFTGSDIRIGYSALPDLVTFTQRTFAERSADFVVVEGLGFGSGKNRSQVWSIVGDLLEYLAGTQTSLALFD